MKRPISSSSQSPNPRPAPRQPSPTLVHPRPRHPTRLKHSPFLEPFPAPAVPKENSPPRSERNTPPQPFVPAARNATTTEAVPGPSNPSSENASGSNSVFTNTFSNSTVGTTPLAGPSGSGSTRMFTNAPQTTIPSMPSTPPIPYQSFYHLPFQTEYGFQPWPGQATQAAAPEQQQWQTPGAAYHSLYQQTDTTPVQVLLPYRPPTPQIQPRALSRTLPPLDGNNQMLTQPVSPPVVQNLPPLEPVPNLPPPTTEPQFNFQLYPTYGNTPRNSPASLLDCDFDELRQKMFERRRNVRSLSHQKQWYARQLFQFERNRLLRQLEELRKFEGAEAQDFASAQKDYFDLLAETDYTENPGILGPLTILLKLEKVVATMTAEHNWIRDVLSNAGIDVDGEEDEDQL